MSDTPLAQHLKALIRTHGSITVEYFMEQSLHHEIHGYYRRDGQFGAAGDFVTAPEISQVFGELIGLWSAVVWQQMGSPASVNIVELGPGRGTLMADVIRAAKAVPAFRDAMTLHLVEMSEPLKIAQRNAVADLPRVKSPSNWADLDLTDGPVIVIANEFLDAMPIEQHVFHERIWRQRGITLDSKDAFAFTPCGGYFNVPDVVQAPSEGDVMETCGAIQDIAHDIVALAEDDRQIAALFIDYGHAASGYGDTLQGVKAHRYVSPFETPGETDLTTHVDFAAFAQAFQGSGLVAAPLVTQAEFLGTLGIIERASRLMAANPTRAGDIEAGVARLMAPNGMGTRFKVMGVANASLTPLPGFASP